MKRYTRGALIALGLTLTTGFALPVLTGPAYAGGVLSLSQSAAKPKIRDAEQKRRYKARKRVLKPQLEQQDRAVDQLVSQVATARVVARQASAAVNANNNFNLNNPQAVNNFMAASNTFNQLQGQLQTAMATRNATRTQLANARSFAVNGQLPAMQQHQAQAHANHGSQPAHIVNNGPAPGAPAAPAGQNNVYHAPPAAVITAYGQSSLSGLK
jgi:hypothetical protein